MRRIERREKKAVVRIRVGEFVGSDAIKGRGESWTLHETCLEEVAGVVDAALDLNPDTLWRIVERGTLMADTPDNRAALWGFFLSRGHAASPVQVDP